MRDSDILPTETFRDRVSTVTQLGKRKWIFASKPNGKWYNFRKGIAWFYLLLFFILPFIKVNDLPLVLINVIEGKFILFSKIFWPQDFFIFSVAMITFIVFIVLFTVAFGRLFCGWVCPQTIFMEFIFRPIEWLIEGTPSQQIKLTESKLNGFQIFKKLLKHFLFIAISFFISVTFIAYILGVEEIFKDFNEPISNHIGLLSGLIIFTFLFYGVFAFARELVCTTICPYGRLQGVMFDKDTIQIAYDYNRGEPRSKLKRNEARTDGDCISCSKCIQVCPTGIDIRNGLQMECIGCAACIDACNDVMKSIHFKKGLIRYASENELQKGQQLHFNTRMKAYAILLTLLCVGMIFLVATRVTIDTYISRVKGPLYQEITEGQISNLFEAKTINKSREEIVITFKLEDLPGVIQLIGRQRIRLKAESITKYNFFLEIPKTSLIKHTTILKIGIYKDGEKIQTIKTKFLGPYISKF